MLGGILVIYVSFIFKLLYVFLICFLNVILLIFIFGLKKKMESYKINNLEMLVLICVGFGCDMVEVWYVL